MCVILVGRVSDIKKVGLEEAWACNPDGAGLAYPDNRGKVKIIKGLMTLKALREALNGVNRNTKIALHLRYATHGSVTAENTHPFPIGKSGSYLMHNGVLESFGRSGRDGVSDSSDLARVLGEIKDPKDRRKILDSIGGKFCIISSEKISVVRSTSWTKIGDVLASNDHFRVKKMARLEWEQLAYADSKIWNWTESIA